MVSLCFLARNNVKKLIMYKPYNKLLQTFLKYKRGLKLKQLNQERIIYLKN